MAGGTGPTLAQQPAKPIIIAVAAIALLAFIAWLAYANLLAPPKTPPMSKQEQDVNNWIKQKAKESGGDPSKLSKEDYDKLQRITGGRGEMALRGFANNPQ
ncbi:MAG TPA: hypothetical protein VFB38_06490 [Chthonomonadaceae bacterium]|nr:hypothetical protein [Chthonomonadaceae bacterium]